jgi:hypothetical protein
VSRRLITAIATFFTAAIVPHEATASDNDAQPAVVLIGR